MKTVLITGTSSGIGRATVKYFSNNGWNVAATMRTPEKETELQQLKNVKLYALDVNDETSIQQAVGKVISDFGNIDVLVNNAGYAVVGPFEASTPENIQQQFETNVFGVMRMTRAVLPHFRSRNNGTVITVTSMGGLLTFPLYSLYHSTKWAVEGFMESLQYELRQFNIKIKCIEPGVIKTDFYERSMNRIDKPAFAMYDKYSAVCHGNMDKSALKGSAPDVVAKKIVKVANSGTFRLRYPVGGQAPLLLFLRKLLPNRWFFGMVRMAVEKGFRG